MESDLKSDFDVSLEKIIEQYNLYFLEIVKKINLPNIWNQKSSFEIEIKKSFIRGVLRYSYFTSQIRNEIIKLFKKNFPNDDKINWITLPYPMIHLSNDQVEDGGFHIDGHDQNSLLTTWLPISNYDYPALSFFKNTWLTRICYRFFFKLNPVAKIFSSNIYAKQGNIFFWDGKFIHSGNINTSNKISCAIQLKLSNEIYDFEQSQNINKDMKLNFNNLNLEEIDDLYLNYTQAIKIISDDYRTTDMFENVRKFTMNFNDKSFIISFALSVLCQRLITKKKFFNEKFTSDEFLKILDISSLVLGSSNLICLQRVLNKISEKENFIKKLKKNDFKKCIPFDSYQFNKITSNTNQTNSTYFSY